MRADSDRVCYLVTEWTEQKTLQTVPGEFVDGKTDQLIALRSKTEKMMTNFDSK